MKKILIVILAITLVSLCSCAGRTNKVIPSQSKEEDITITNDNHTDGAITIDSGETISVDSMTDVPGLPDQSFIGVWSTDELKTNQILIWEITEDSVKFNSGVLGMFGFDATGVAENGEIVFGDGVSPDYSGPVGLKGRMEFSENSITLIYDDFGSIEDSEYCLSRYTFTFKDENSESIISQYKSSIGK